MRHPVGQHAGLARTSTRNHQQWPARVKNGVLLIWVQRRDVERNIRSLVCHYPCRLEARYATIAPGDQAESCVVANNDKLFILLPPSEGKALSGSTGTKFKETDGCFGKVLAKQRAEIISALRIQHGGSQKLLGVSGTHLARAQQANLALRGAKTLPARERYTGVVWDHLDLASLTSAQQKFADANIIVVSGLLGLVCAGDAIPDYRLKIGASLEPLGKLSTWWRKELSLVLNKYCAGAVVVDLLPQEHSAAFMPDENLLNRYFRVDLATKSGTAGGHDAKAAKGLLARHLITNHNNPDAALKTFKDPKFKVRVLKKF